MSEGRVDALGRGWGCQKVGWMPWGGGGGVSEGRVDALGWGGVSEGRVDALGWGGVSKGRVDALGCKVLSDEQ